MKFEKISIRWNREENRFMLVYLYVCRCQFTPVNIYFLKDGTCLLIDLVSAPYIIYYDLFYAIWLISSYF